MDFHLSFGKFILVVCIHFCVLLCTTLGEISEDSNLYPIIISTEADKAVFIVPDVGCHILTDFRYANRDTLLQQPHVYRTDGRTVDNVIDLCDLYQKDRINATQFVVGLREKAFLIFPGTHFCGAGDNAANDTDFGYYIETDKCCREHDHCLDYVAGWSCHEELPELCNRTPFTRSHCNCDQKFRECLQAANETASVHIGLLYFTVFGLKCFREDYPILECQEYGGFLHLHCQKYTLDETQEKVFQFFDSPRFTRGSIIHANDTTLSTIMVFKNRTIKI